MRLRSKAPSRASSRTASSARASTVGAELTPTKTRIGSIGRPFSVPARKRLASKSSDARGISESGPIETVGR